MTTFDLNKFKSSRSSTKYVTRNGKRIAIATLNIGRSKPKKRKPFKVWWVKLPDYWIAQLDKATSISTLKLAHRILREAYKRGQVGGDIVLSTEVTELPRQSRCRATKELVELKLIEVEQYGNQAVKVTRLRTTPPRPSGVTPRPSGVTPRHT